MASQESTAPTQTAGAESSGEIDGCGWRVFTIRDRSKPFRIVAVTCAPNVRKKTRIPPKYTTVEDRARFARGAAAALVKIWREEVRARQEADPPTPTPTLVTFDAFGRLWTSGKLAEMYPGRVKVKATSGDDKQRLDFIKSIIGDVPLKEFDVRDGEKVLAALPKGRSPSTLRHYAQVINRILNLAIYPGKIIDKNPLPRGFLPPVAPQKAMSFLYPDEEATLMRCEAIPIQRRILFGFLAREGPRYGEAARLQWSDLDAIRHVLNLDKNKTDDPRFWKIGDDVARALATYRENHPEPGPDGRIFLDENSAAFEEKKMAQTLRDDLVLAGIDRPQLFERTAERIPMRVHDLRASFVTLALASDRTETWVIDRTGHKSSAMVARYRRKARVAAELNLGWFEPLDQLLFETVKTIAVQKKPTSDAAMTTKGRARSLPTIKPPATTSRRARTGPRRRDAGHQKSVTCSANCSACGTAPPDGGASPGDFSAVTQRRAGDSNSWWVAPHLISNQAPSATRSALHLANSSIGPPLSSGGGLTAGFLRPLDEAVGRRKSGCPMPLTTTMLAARLRASETTPQAFEDAYVVPARPVLVEGMIDGWPARSLWSPAYFIEKVGDVRASVSVSTDGIFRFGDDGRVPAVDVDIRAYTEALLAPKPGERMYLQQLPIPTNLPALATEIAPPALLGNIAPNLVNLWFGGGGNTSPLHFDLDNNFLVQVFGTKRVVLFPPSDWENLYANTPPSPPHMSRVDLAAPDYDAFPAAANARGFEVWLAPGQTLYIPPYWWHQVESLDVSASVNFWWSARPAQCIVPATTPAWFMPPQLDLRDFASRCDAARFFLQNDRPEIAKQLALAALDAHIRALSVKSGVDIDGSLGADAPDLVGLNERLVENGVYTADEGNALLGSVIPVLAPDAGAGVVDALVATVDAFAQRHPV